MLDAGADTGISPVLTSASALHQHCQLLFIRRSDQSGFTCRPHVDTALTQSFGDGVGNMLIEGVRLLFVDLVRLRGSC